METVNIRDYSGSGRHKKSRQKLTVGREVLEERERKRNRGVWKEKLEIAGSEMKDRKK